MILAVGSSSPPAFFFSQYIALATPAAKSLQSCPTLCDPIDVSPPGSPISGILQARTLEWLLLALSISETFEYLESISCTCTNRHTHTHTQHLLRLWLKFHWICRFTFTLLGLGYLSIVNLSKRSLIISAYTLIVSQLWFPVFFRF